MSSISWLIPLLPLLAAAACGFIGKETLRGKSHLPVWGAIGVAFLISFFLLLGQLFAGGEGTIGVHSHWFTWIDALDFKAAAGAYLDPLSVVMLNVVTGIGLLIAIFSAGYMKGEEGYWRFFAYVALFIFAMTILVMGDNLVLLFLGWEGVGLCSYLLIGYDIHKTEARDAAQKAFIVNRIGDFGFLVGIMLCFYAFGTVNFFDGGAGLVEKAAAFMTGNTDVVAADRQWAISVIPFALMLGAFGKSAQFPLYVWLPDAMAGPTPVSALIHAATMVTAGVYMIVRMGPLFYGNPAALTVIAVVGVFTALFAATIALRQFDLKKVFAYSTVSQLGFMFVGVACLAPVAGIFHLVTHAFFKALLFLSAGVVMHAMLGHLDIRKMSGLGRRLPLTKWVMLAGCLALAGFPLTSGFWSKDEIIHASGYSSGLAYVLLLGTALLTAYYTFRVWFRLFTGPEVVPHDSAEGHHDVSHADAAHATHSDEPNIMLWPLFVLAAGALLIGFINTPVISMLGHFLGRSESLELSYHVAMATFPQADPGSIAHGFGAHSDEPVHGVWTGLILGMFISLLGIAAAWYVHSAHRTTEATLVRTFRPFARIFEGKYWVDEVYQALIVNPLRALGRGLSTIDRFVIDGAVWLVSFVPQLAGFGLKLGAQRGSLQGYAVMMLAGIAVLALMLLA